ncbi:hypothetical protein A2625_01700 [candidate division WOR-1 bacterium RIFCSPHIGHO2_01_FULL_53_15]|uniref:Nitroreductase domain-containing protein n=1 Tax=candidate division WOR-1 bacterium RIFCSPHIGHO2_01_FULL_53_15 TaxID=1802564 RepID=A0A1F4Q1W3_UNCSA|nr:MAG: hypothetical protein A2625_01700 [candidate division WOR-1 bacterium RIFCSPHIGHO2_01_FULL_53_15]OGC13635.1 MAG: hypothetical protein A3D23_06305 [candidate division WOR-1 bacterium RIFCSPHIGHO2_02_FULL_53_26]
MKTAQHPLVVFHAQSSLTLQRGMTEGRKIDRANQPSPFRSYAGAPVVKLPQPEKYLEGVWPSAIIKPADFTLQRLSNLLYYSAAISAWKQDPKTHAAWALRVNASAGNLHDEEVHLIAEGVSGLENGLYHFNARNFSLELRAPLTPELKQMIAAVSQTEAPLKILLTSLFDRQYWKYGERGWRYCLLDTGHQEAAVRSAGAQLGWPSVVTRTHDDQKLGSVFGLAHDEEVPLAFIEFSLQLKPHGTWTPQTIAFHGQPTPILGTHKQIVDPVTVMAIAATAGEALSRESISTQPFSVPVRPPFSRQRPWIDLVRKRRSATAFDPQSRITNEELRWLLRQAFNQSAYWRQGIIEQHFTLAIVYAQRVAGLEPAIYLYSPGNDQLLEHKKLPIDISSLAGQHALGQEIVSAGAVTIAILTDMQQVLNAFGEKGYRLIHQQAGVVGQALYLAAESLGLQGTAIGAFDDIVPNKLLGMPESMMCLELFALGKARPDQRLTTLPAYGFDQQKTSFDPRSVEVVPEVHTDPQPGLRSKKFMPEGLEALINNLDIWLLQSTAGQFADDLPLEQVRQALGAVSAENREVLAAFQEYQSGKKNLVDFLDTLLDDRFRFLQAQAATVIEWLLDAQVIEAGSARLAEKLDRLYMRPPQVESLEPSPEHRAIIDRSGYRTQFPGRMVDCLLKHDRRLFAPALFTTAEAASDSDLPIGFRQEMTRPSLVATILSHLDIQPGQRVLEIGYGSGWLLAMLADLVGETGEVYGSEIHPALARRGAENVARFGYKNVEWIPTDADGFPDAQLLLEEQFDAIIVSGENPLIGKGHRLKRFLTQLLRDGGHLVTFTNGALDIQRVNSGEDDSGQSFVLGNMIMPPLRLEEALERQLAPEEWFLTKQIELWAEIEYNQPALDRILANERFRPLWAPLFKALEEKTRREALQKYHPVSSDRAVRDELYPYFKKFERDYGVLTSADVAAERERAGFKLAMTNAENYLRNLRNLTSETIDRVMAGARHFPRVFFLPEFYTEENAYWPIDYIMDYGHQMVSLHEQLAYLAFLGVAPGERVFEVGPGTAWLSFIMSHIVGEQGRVDALELVQEIVDLAKRKQAYFGVKTINFYQGDVNRDVPAYLRSSAGTYDRVLVACTAPENAVEELGGLLKPGGRLIHPVYEDSPNGKNMRFYLKAKRPNGRLKIVSSQAFEMKPPDYEKVL